MTNIRDLKNHGLVVYKKSFKLFQTFAYCGNKNFKFGHNYGRQN